MSYTETHAVTSYYTCNTCQVTISGDNIPDNLVEMIYANHEGHDFGPASPNDPGEGVAAVVGDAGVLAGVEPSSHPAGPKDSHAAS